MLKNLLELLLTNFKDNSMIHGALLIVGDTTFCSKTGNSMLGLQKWFDHSGNSDRNSYIFGHNWGLVGLITHFKDRYFCWPILSRLVSGKKNPSHYVCELDGTVRPMDFFESMHAPIFEVKSHLPNDPLRVVVDAFFANGKFINPLVEKGIDVVTRWRKDGVGRDPALYYCGRGRPPKYGQKRKLADLLKCFPIQECRVKIYGKEKVVGYVSRNMYLKGIPKKVKIVVIKGEREPVILISTDLSLSVQGIIEIYSSRFQVEITIRDLKQYFGFGGYQCRSSISIIRFSFLSCIANCLGRLMLLNEKAVECSTENKRSESKYSFSKMRNNLRRFVIKEIILSNSALREEDKKKNHEYDLITKISA